VPTWNNLVEPEGKLKDAQGNILTGEVYAPFSRTTTCGPVYTGQQSGLLAPSLVSIKVEVYCKGTPLVSINRMVSE
jgi:hypothetical protein